MINIFKKDSITDTNTDEIPCIVIANKRFFNNCYFAGRLQFDFFDHKFLFKKHKFNATQSESAYKFTENPFGVIAYLFAQFICEENIDNDLNYNNELYHIDLLDSLIKSKIGRDIEVNARLSFDPRPFMSKTNHIHLPSFTLTTLNKFTDDPFCGNHVLHIIMKKTDPGAYLDKITANDGEREILLPRNTTIKIIESIEKENRIEHIAVIDNNINPERIQKSIQNIMPILDYNFIKFYRTNKKISKKMKQFIKKK